MSHTCFTVNVHSVVAWISGSPLLETNKRDIWSLSNCDRNRFRNHLARKRTLNYLALLSRGDFWMIWRYHGFRVFIFIFCLETAVIKEQFDENDFRHCYGNFSFESVIPKVYSYVQSSFSTIRKHLDNGIWKTRCNWRFYGHGPT